MEDGTVESEHALLWLSGRPLALVFSSGGVELLGEAEAQWR
jgi:hypothetical protein